MSDLTSFTTARKQARAMLHAGWLEGGTLVIYDSTPTALVAFTLPGTITPANGEIEITPITEMIAETGLAASAKTFDSASGEIAGYSVGLTGSGNAVELNSLNLVEGGYVTLTGFTLIEG